MVHHFRQLQILASPHFLCALPLRVQHLSLTMSRHWIQGGLPIRMFKASVRSLLAGLMNV